MKKTIITVCLALGFVSAAWGTQTTENPFKNHLTYYGEISAKTGRPKTNHVNGYYRSNGTYVKSYYRSV